MRRGLSWYDLGIALLFIAFLAWLVSLTGCREPVAPPCVWRAALGVYDRHTPPDTVPVWACVPPR